MIQRLLILLFLSLFLTACTGDGTEPDDTPTPDEKPVVDITFDSFDEVAKGVFDDNESKTITLSGLAVQGYETGTLTRPNANTEWDYEHFTSGSGEISKIDAPLISLTFDKYEDDDGDLISYISTASLYIGNGIYTALADDEERGHTYFEGEITNHDDEDKEITLNRYFYSAINAQNDFGADYMVNINWYLGEDLSETATTDTVSGYDGYMVAGFETAGNNIPRHHMVAFKGVGLGNYLTPSSYRAPSFNVTANVNFSTRMVALATTNTGYCNEYDSEYNCTGFTFLNDIDFSATLSYAPNTNSISGNIAVDGMNGTADARFYGGAVEELGGTFYMTNGANNYYYGYFGAKRDYRSLTEASDVAENSSFEKNFVLKAVGLQTVFTVTANSDNTTTNSVAITEITGNPITSLTFDGGFGDIVSTSIEIGEQIHSLDDYSNSSAFAFGGVTTPSNDSNNLYTLRLFSTSDDDSFNFISNYMVGNIWTYHPDNDSDATTTTFYTGAMIAGFETDGSHIPTGTGTVVFKGTGLGYHQNNGTDGLEGAHFDVKADVDFSARNIGLTTSNTYYDDDDDNPVTLPALNFTSTLTYDTNTNNITGNVTANGMSGTANARFYGTGDNVAEELGGTFYMTANADTYYYGYFGATSAGDNRLTLPNDDDNTGGDNNGGDNTGGDNNGGDNTGGDNNGGDNTGGDNGGYETPVFAGSIPNIYDGDNRITDIIVNNASAVNTLGYNTLEAIADSVKVDEESKTLILSGVAVEEYITETFRRSNSNYYWRQDEGGYVSGNSSVSSITKSVIEITYDNYEHEYYGKTPYISGLNLYLGGKTYTATNNERWRSDNRFDGTITNRNDDKKDITLSSDFYTKYNSHNDHIVGLTSKYMVHIDWDIASYLSDMATMDSISEYSGYMVTGFATTGNNIPTNDGNVRFKGLGNGYYLNGQQQEYETDFNVIADVNFSSYQVDLTIDHTETYSCNDDYECHGVSLAHLDFDATLTYAPSTNSISGTVEADGMSGTANARFYGTKGVTTNDEGEQVAYNNAAQELGGTFAMRENANEYHYGYFGATQSDGIDDFISNYGSSDADYKGYASLDAASAYADNNNEQQTLILTGLAAEDNTSYFYNRPDTNTAWNKATHFDGRDYGDVTRLNDPIIHITFDVNGNIAKADIYASDFNNYLATLASDTTGSATEFRATKFDDGSSYVTDDYTDYTGYENYMNIRKVATSSNTDTSFSFTSQYMLATYWLIKDTLLDDDYEYEFLETIEGYMIAGIESDSSAIADSTGTASFKGGGYGSYQMGANTYYSEFDVTADVNFSARTVGVATSNTEYCISVANSNCGAYTSLPQLDFSSALTYAAATNNISGVVLTDDGMKGTIDARFYGPAAEELGGRFAMKNNDHEYYYGYFGTKKQ
ncbi:MAG: transferrin-binding protein-like solute binding protein [Alphaproteobacteria bacterium]|nr:transferrin-binding protein-like solute binding protein [Alphaproteobacteria bacterium]